ncbi:MAG: NVEALA domain-containing protein [Bacteroidaceae bacterium]|nr:NVEALA domain-containing protein [Bacteroidaceae bacterium]
MKKKIFSAVVVTAALFTGYSAYNMQNRQELSDTLLANVEALANGDESEREKVECYSSIEYEEESYVVYCSTCQSMKNHTDKWYCIHSHCFRDKK